MPMRHKIVAYLVYSTMIDDVLAELVALAVAFVFTVMFTDVAFDLAVSAVSVEVRLPLDVAEDMSDEKEFVRFAALPLYSAVSRRLSSSFDRAITISRRITSLKLTSTSVTAPDVPFTFTACTFWT